MSAKKKQPQTKSRLHKRNKHRERYDLKALQSTSPELANFIVENKYGDETVDFFNPDAVLALNKALLMHFYKVDFWEIPKNYLCPPIPGRADYLHYIADVMMTSNYGKLPTGSKIKCLDIGVGANCVYPIIGNAEYGWSFIGSDIDKGAVESAAKIVESNSNLENNIDCRLQEDPSKVFTGILKEGEKIDIAICNPPFHASLEEAQAGTLRKLSNLKGKKVNKAELNFGGQGTELWTEGGEKRFILDMIAESKKFSKSCLWFSTLVSKESTLQHIYRLLESLNVTEYETIDMGQGNKSSRIVVWTFLTVEHEKQWVKERWN